MRKKQAISKSRIYSPFRLLLTMGIGIGMIVKIQASQTFHDYRDFDDGIATPLFLKVIHNGTR